MKVWRLNKADDQIGLNDGELKNEILKLKILKSRKNENLEVENFEVDEKIGVKICGLEPVDR